MAGDGVTISGDLAARASGALAALGACHALGCQTAGGCGAADGILNFHCFNFPAFCSAQVVSTHSVQIEPILGILMPKMGSTTKSPRAAPSLADALFTGTQQRVLALLFGQPARSFYANELIGLAGMGSGAVQRELRTLAGSGLVTVRSVGNQKHYQANADAPIFEDLRGIVQKTFGLAEPLRQVLGPLAKRLAAAFVYGSVAKNTDTAASDIDLMVISDEVTYADLFAALDAASATFGRTVNPTVLTRKELAKRVKAKEAFTTRVLAQPKIWIVGDDSVLAA
ncbi:MAG: nucleotidyltransferase domain-containing protein [Burkholderiales bacterium]